MDRAQGLRRAAGLTGLLAAFGVAGSLAVATLAYAARNDNQATGSDPASTVDSDDGDNGSAWPELSTDEGNGSGGGHATSGGS